MSPPPTEIRKQNITKLKLKDFLENLALDQNRQECFTADRSVASITMRASAVACISQRWRYRLKVLVGLCFMFRETLASYTNIKPKTLFSIRGRVYRHPVTQNSVSFCKLLKSTWLKNVIGLLQEIIVSCLLACRKVHRLPFLASPSSPPPPAPTLLVFLESTIAFLPEPIQPCNVLITFKLLVHQPPFQ